MTRKYRLTGMMVQTIDLGVLGEQKVTVAYNYTPGTPDVMYLPNGDPGHPGDPAKFEVLEVRLDELDLTHWVLGNNDLIHDWINEAARIEEDTEATARAGFYASLWDDTKWERENAEAS